MENPRIRNTRGFFSIGIYGGKDIKNLGSLWRTAHIFDASYIFTIQDRYHHQPSDTSKASKHLPYFHFSDIDTFLDSLPYKITLVCVETPDVVGYESTPLYDFAHPERAAYILGSEDHGVPPELISAAEHCVYIPGSYSLNVAVAGSFVIYDRYTKTL